MVKGKVNCILVQALRLCTSRTAHRGSRHIAIPYLDHVTRRGSGASVTPRPFFTPRKDPVPIVQEGGWVPRPIWTSAENLAPTGIRYPDRPVRSQSLYRLRYPAHHDNMTIRHLQSDFEVFLLFVVYLTTLSLSPVCIVGDVINP